MKVELCRYVAVVVRTRKYLHFYVHICMGRDENFSTTVIDRYKRSKTRIIGIVSVIRIVYVVHKLNDIRRKKKPLILTNKGCESKKMPIYKYQTLLKDKVCLFSDQMKRRNRFLCQ